MDAVRSNDRTAKPKKKRVIIQRQVTEKEYLQHKERMERMGLDPSEPAPVTLQSLSADPHAPLNDVNPAASITAPAQHVASTTIPEAAETLPPKRDTKTQVSLQMRTLEEQIQSRRHERALAKWAQQQQQWEDFRHHAASKTGRAKEHLVVSRTEEYREKMEVMELLDQATPEEIKSGGHSWYHSLRGGGTRYVQVGNMFSGLHIPMKLHKEKYDHEIIRKPLLRDLVNSRQDADGERQGPRTWRDDEYLLARLRRYQKKMTELAPGKLEMHEILEPEVVKVPVTTGERSLGSKSEGAHGTRSPDDDIELTGTRAPVPGEIDVSEIGDGLKSSPCSPSAPIPSTEECREGPHIQVLPDKLQFKIDVNDSSTHRIRLKNIGTAVIEYEWVLNETPKGFQESILPSDPTVRFMCHNTKGKVLPTGEADTLFTFTSITPGGFTSSWCLNTYPELSSPIRDVQMHGMAFEEDLLRERRQAFQTTIFQQQVLHQVQELIEDVVESVKLQPPPPIDVTRPLLQERLFEEHNSSLNLFWSPAAWDDLGRLNTRIREMQLRANPQTVTGDGTNIPGDMAPSREDTFPARGRRPKKKSDLPNASSYSQGLERTDAIPLAERMQLHVRELKPSGSGVDREKRDLVVDVFRTTRSAQVRPLERSPLWWVGYETILKIVTSLPERWALTRQSAELSPLPFIAPLPADSPPEMVSRYNEQLEERNRLLGEEPKEKEIRELFAQNFEKDIFGPNIAKFGDRAHETSMVCKVQEVANMSLRDRIQPCMNRQTIESVELGGSVVLYEVDLRPISSQLSKDDAKSGTADEPVSFNLDSDTEQAVLENLAGLATILEGHPLAILVIGHLGEPLSRPAASERTEVGNENSVEPPGDGNVETDATPVPDAIDSAVQQAGLNTVVSIAPLLEILRKFCEGIASSVEFVSHEYWLGNTESFSDRVRDDTVENKVFLMENMVAFPEELGRRYVDQGSPQSGILPLTWATREAWAMRQFQSLHPVILVQDSFSVACKSYTLGSGLWGFAPQRILGPLIEGEFIAFMEALQLNLTEPAAGNFRTTAQILEDAHSDLFKVAKDMNDPAPLLVAIGGGGFTSDVHLLKKLQLVMGLAHLTHHEKDGLLIYLAGQLAVCVYSCLLGIQLGTLSWKPSLAAITAMKEMIVEILKLGVTIILPTEFVCQKLTHGTATPESQVAGDGPPANENEEEETQTFPLREALTRASDVPVPCGFVDGEVCSFYVDASLGILRIQLGLVKQAPRTSPSVPDTAPASPKLPQVNTASNFDFVPKDGILQKDEQPGTQEGASGIPEGWVVRDISDKVVDDLRAVLRRCRGVIWNGAFGVWEDSRWLKGTRGFLSAIEKRLVGDYEEEEENDDADEDGDNQNEAFDDYDDVSSIAPSLATRADGELEVDFEVALVLGEDSTKRLPSLMQNPKTISFVSRSGDGLLQVLRGDPLPGLFACNKKTKSN